MAAMLLHTPVSAAASFARRNAFSSRARVPRQSVRAAVAVPTEYKTVKPIGDRVLVKIDKEETRTAGGIMLPASAAKKPTAGNVVSAAAEAKDVKVGEKVVYSKYAGTEVQVQNEDYILLKEEDVIGTLPASKKISLLQPLGDRVLLKNMEAQTKTAGGLLLTTESAEKPTVGQVVAVGPGRRKEDSEEIVKPTISVGNTVLYSKYSGTEFEDDDETQYIVIREMDVLAVLA